MQLWSGKIKTHRRGITMRFMMIVKSAEKWGFPPKELMDAIGKLSEEAVKAGTILGNGGLLPSAKGTSVRISGGKLIVKDGPFTEAKEDDGGYAQFELPPKEVPVKSPTPLTQRPHQLVPHSQS